MLPVQERPKTTAVMDEIREAIARHGNVWTVQTNSDMTELYEPLHAQQAQRSRGQIKIEKGLKYGDHERHRIDVYRPTDAASGASIPVVVFFHGGTLSSSTPMKVAHVDEN